MGRIGRIEADEGAPPVRIPARILQELYAHSLEAGDEECCGLIVSDGFERYGRAVRCRNEMTKRHKEDPKTYPRDNHAAYYMSDHDVMEVRREAERTGVAVTAVYHSHVSERAYLSAMDLRYAQHALFPFPDADQIVLSVFEHIVREVRIFVRDQAGFTGYGVQADPGGRTSGSESGLVSIPRVPPKEPAMSDSGGSDLVPVHGGGAAPVDRVVPLSQRRRFIAEAEPLPSVRVNRADLSTVYRIADGALSPLTGPMREAVYHQVLDERRILVGKRPYAWTIPLALPVSDDEAGELSRGGSAAIRNEEGGVVAILDDLEVFDWDKAKYVRRVYGTDRFDHPGGRQVEQDVRTKLVGGELRALPQPVHPEYGEYMLSPRMTRAFIQDRKWERALAFQTRNPLHRAHEYALVAGAERLTSGGHFTGVVLNPLVGELKGDDVPAVVRMRAYRKLHDDRLLGQGDKDDALWQAVGYDLSDVFELIGLDIKMFYGGPSEAVMHAIYRQNYGFSHLVIGRKHADAPFEDGNSIWGDFDAQEVFGDLAGELHLAPCNIGFAAYYESIGRVDLTERHPDEKPVSVSGTKVRDQLRSGERPDPRIMRPEIADILIDAFRS